MIQDALLYVRDSLNEHFKNEFQISENKVVLSNIVKPDGGMAQNVDGKIVFFLVSLDEESTLKNNINRSISAEGSSFAQKIPPMHLNMQVIFCANFDSAIYTEGLSYLSSLIRFFQINRKIEISNSNKNRRKLSFELCKLDYAQLSHLWSAIGSKLMPSVLYKASMVVFDDTAVGKVVPLIKSPENQT